MAFVYGVEGAPATPYACHATPNTEDPTLVLRQATRGFDLQAIWVQGRGRHRLQTAALDDCGHGRYRGNPCSAPDRDHG